jgi:hypothetical protein
MYIKYLRTRREANGRPMKELRAVFLCCFFYFNFLISSETYVMLGNGMCPGPAGKMSFPKH